MAGRKYRKVHITVRQYRVGFVLLLLFTVVVTATVFYQVYTVSRQNLINTQKVNTMQLARDVDYYLMCPRDAISFASNRVEKMMKNGASGKEILSYLREETEVYENVVDSNITGIYGYCNGDYLDGSGWIPPEGYDPTERPWYTSAVKAGGEITFVRPFLNLQTNTMMMSVARSLYDVDSVVSMDIFLDSVQDMSEGMLTSGDLDAVMVVDGEGFVVACSDEDEIGKDYGTGAGNYGKTLVEGLQGKDEAEFSIAGPADGPGLGTGRMQMVFSKRLSTGWYAVQILDEKKMMGPLAYIHVIFILVLLVGIMMVTGVFLIVSREHSDAEQFGQLASTDRMTGIRNRISGESEIGLAVEELMEKAHPTPLTHSHVPLADLVALSNRAARTDHSANVTGMFMVMDTDRFKSINDTCGHEVGDQVLIHIADSLRLAFREGDIVFRLGGDEFAGFAPGIGSLEEAEPILSDLRARIGNLHLPELKDKAPTVSIGVTFFRSDRKESFGTLYRRADKAMYRSKRAGGNQVTVV